MFPTSDHKEQPPTIDDVTTSVGRFILQFGKVEYALLMVLVELNRIIDGTTIQKKLPYAFDEMCTFFRKSEQRFLVNHPDLPPFDKIADELADLNKIRTILVHSYLAAKTSRPEGTWFTFDRYAPVEGSKNRRELQSYQVKKNFIDDAAEDLNRSRSWLIQLEYRLRKIEPF